MNNIKLANIFMCFLVLYLVFLGKLFGISGSIIGLLLPIMIYCLVTKLSFISLVRIKGLSFKNIVLMILIGFLVQPLMGLMGSIAGLFFTNNVEIAVSQFIELPLYILIIKFVLSPAIFEELAFRGFLYNLTKDDLGIKKTAILTGFFFGIIHLDFQQFFYAFAMGVIFTYLVYYTGSIVSSMIVHFVVNGTQIVIMYLSKDSIIKDNITEVITLSQKIQQIGVSFMAVIVTVPILIYVIKMVKRINQSSIEYLAIPTQNYKIVDKFFIILIFIYLFFTVII